MLTIIKMISPCICEAVESIWVPVSLEFAVSFPLGVGFPLPVWFPVPV